MLATIWVQSTSCYLCRFPKTTNTSQRSFTRNYHVKESKTRRRECVQTSIKSETILQHRPKHHLCFSDALTILYGTDLQLFPRNDFTNRSPTTSALVGFGQFGSLFWIRPMDRPLSELFIRGSRVRSGRNESERDPLSARTTPWLSTSLPPRGAFVVIRDLRSYDRRQLYLPYKVKRKRERGLATRHADVR